MNNPTASRLPGYNNNNNTFKYRQTKYSDTKHVGGGRTPADHHTFGPLVASANPTHTLHNARVGGSWEASARRSRSLLAWRERRC
eukprot:2110422-Pyramimonas_sp.AAC.1